MDKNLFTFKINVPKIIFLKRTKTLKDDICVKQEWQKNHLQNPPKNPALSDHVWCNTSVTYWEAFLLNGFNS